MKEIRIHVGDVAVFHTGPGGVEVHVSNHATHIEVRAIGGESFIPQLLVDRHQDNLVFCRPIDPNRTED
jgi:hypothetical protein